MSADYDGMLLLQPGREWGTLEVTATHMTQQAEFVVQVVRIGSLVVIRLGCIQCASQYRLAWFIWVELLACFASSVAIGQQLDRFNLCR